MRNKKALCLFYVQPFLPTTCVVQSGAPRPQGKDKFLLKIEQVMTVKSRLNKSLVKT